jgi:nicotinamidase-related amidase
MNFRPEWIAPVRTALLLIDCQADFGAPHGEMARRGMDMSAPQAALDEAVRLLEAARGAGVMPVFVRLLTLPGTESEVLKEAKRRKSDPQEGDLCVAGTPGAAFVTVRPRGREWIVDKTRYSAFTGIDLAGRLKAEGIDTLVLAGLTTECCVAATAWSAIEADFHVFLAGDACAAYDDGLHQGALRALDCSGAIVLPAGRIAEIWEDSNRSVT